MIKKKIFKAYDIRGRYPEEINEKIAVRIARSLARYFFKEAPQQARGITIIVGHDARLSSPKLYKAVLGVMCQVSGVKIIEVGLITTPMLYFLVNRLKAAGGIMITASHNPKEFNGMKVVGPKAAPMSGEEIKKLVIRNEK